jgi:hypothetical protein
VDLSYLEKNYKRTTPRKGSHSQEQEDLNSYLMKKSYTRTSPIKTSEKIAALLDFDIAARAWRRTACESRSAALLIDNARARSKRTAD